MTARNVGSASKPKWIAEFRWLHRSGPKQGTSERFRKVAPINTKRGADEFEQYLKQRLWSGESLDPERPAQVQTLAAFTERFIEHAMNVNKPSEVTMKKSIFKHHLLPHFENTPLDKIGPLEIETLRTALRGKELSAKRINNIVACLQRALEYAHELDLIEKPRRVKALKAAPQIIHMLRPVEFEQLLAAARNNVQVYAMLLVAGEAGRAVASVRWRSRAGLQTRFEPSRERETIASSIVKTART